MEPAAGTTTHELIAAVQDLFLARSLVAVQHVGRRSARCLTGADGATFVLKDDDHCLYADEEAIAPRWKGRRIPMDTCISGWSMLHPSPLAGEEGFAARRGPADPYRRTR